MIYSPHQKGGITIYEIIILCFGAWLTGVSKAGFGGGIGMIVVPMFTHFRTARNVIGLMLLLLFSTDVFSLSHYWRRWHRQSVTRLILGSLLGITLASFILKDISDVHLKKVIGGIACLFAVLEFLRPYWQPLLGNSGQSTQAPLQFKIVSNDHRMVGILMFIGFQATPNERVKLNSLAFSFRNDVLSD